MPTVWFSWADVAAGTRTALDILLCLELALILTRFWVSRTSLCSAPILACFSGWCLLGTQSLILDPAHPSERQRDLKSDTEIPNRRRYVSDAYVHSSTRLMRASCIWRLRRTRSGMLCSFFALGHDCKVRSITSCPEYF